jgi:predicted  nucleic acid-binding Zn-ribbon protein
MIRAVRPTLVVLVIFSAGAVTSMVGSAQTASGSPDILSALLTEVRGLRTAIEQMATAAPRVQLALGRLQIQEQRVAELTRRLDGTRRSLSESQGRLETDSQQWKMLEETLSQQGDPNERRELEQALKHMKMGRQQVLTEIQRLQMEEAAIAQDLTTEQGRWLQFSQQLDEIERSLSRR